MCVCVCVALTRSTKQQGIVVVVKFNTGRNHFHEENEKRNWKTTDLTRTLRVCKASCLMNEKLIPRKYLRKVV